MAGEAVPQTDKPGSLLQNSSGSGIYCREELLSLGARASRPHKTWQGRGDWLHRVGRFTRRLTLEQRLDKYAGGTPALPGGNPWLARCTSLSRALFCRSILPPSHARLRILQKALGKKISTKGIHEETKKISTKGHEEPRMDTNGLIDELLIADCFDSRDPVLRSIIPLIIVLHRLTGWTG